MGSCAAEGAARPGLSGIGCCSSGAHNSSLPDGDPAPLSPQAERRPLSIGHVLNDTKRPRHNAIQLPSKDEKQSLHRAAPGEREGSDNLTVFSRYFKDGSCIFSALIVKIQE